MGEGNIILFVTANFYLKKIYKYLILAIFLLKIQFLRIKIKQYRIFSILINIF